MSNLLTDLRRFSTRSQSVWQLIILPLRGMKVGDKEKAVEPVGCFIASRQTGRAMAIEIAEPGMSDCELACKAISAACATHDARYVPGLMQVRDPELAVLLRAELAPYGVLVEVTDSLDAIDELVAAFSTDMLPPPVPGWLETPGMTPARLSAFAEAAAMMFKAAPWQYLAGEDLIHIESPVSPDKTLQFASIVGAGGEVFGISYFADRENFDRLQRGDGRSATADGVCALLFGDEDRLPPGDADLWLDRQLSLAGDNAYPILLRYPSDKELECLDGPAVTFVEGLCRALAQTSEDQIDAGRWEQRVQTCDGPVTYTLSIPTLLEDMQEGKPKRKAGMPDRRIMDMHMLAMELLVASHNPKSIEEMNAILDSQVVGKVPTLPPPTTPLEQAQWLCFDAFESRGRRRIQLAREALRISPDVADAYCLLAEQRRFDPAGANELFRQGTEAGRRALGEEPFDDPDFPFWKAVRSRPYMRARQGYARTLAVLGRKAEAADEFQALLKLNPGDNQGVRYELAPLLLELNQLDELHELLNTGIFEDDDSAEWAYVRALLSFRRKADNPKSRSEMLAAIRCNRHVPKYLLGRAELPPPSSPYYSPGDEDEALMVARSQKALWEQTPLALEWLGKCKRQINQTSHRRKLRRKR